MTQEFKETVESLLEENNAIDSLSVDSTTAKVFSYTRAGKNAKNDIIVEPVLEGYDVTYNGTKNDWENYTVHESAIDISLDESEIRDVVSEYRSEAVTSRRHTPSFREWYKENI